MPLSISKPCCLSRKNLTISLVDQRYGFIYIQAMLSWFKEPNDSTSRLEIWLCLHPRTLRQHSYSRNRACSVSKLCCISSKNLTIALVQQKYGFVYIQAMLSQFKEPYDSTRTVEISYRYRNSPFSPDKAPWGDSKQCFGPVAWNVSRTSHDIKPTTLKQKLQNHVSKTPLQYCTTPHNIK